MWHILNRCHDWKEKKKIFDKKTKNGNEHGDRTNWMKLNDESKTVYVKTVKLKFNQNNWQIMKVKSTRKKLIKHLKEKFNEKQQISSLKCR